MSHHTKHATCAINDVLPPELLVYILKMVDPRLYPLLRHVCRQWNAWALDLMGEPAENFWSVMEWALMEGRIDFFQRAIVPHWKRLKLDPCGRVGVRADDNRVQANGIMGTLYRCVQRAVTNLTMMRSSMFEGVCSDTFEDAVRKLKALDNVHHPPEPVCRAALAGGHKHMLAYIFPRKLGVKLTTKDLLLAIEVGTLDTFQWVLHRMSQSNVSAHRLHGKEIELAAVRHDRLDVLQYLARQYRKVDRRMDPNHWFEEAVLCVRKRIVAWVVQQDDLCCQVQRRLDDIENVAANEILDSCTEVLLRPIRWNSPIVPADVAYLFDQFNGNARTKGGDDDDDTTNSYSQYLLMRYRDDPDADTSYLDPCNRTSRSYVIAARLDDWAGLERLHKDGIGLSTLVSSQAAKIGDLRLVEWLADHDCPFDAGATLNAANYGHLDLLIWLRDRNCPWNEAQAAWGAKINRHYHVLRWIQQHGELGTKAGQVAPEPVPHEIVVFRKERQEAPDGGLKTKT
jgi:hypothetical protein